MSTVLALSLAAGTPTPAPYQPPFDPRALKEAVAGERSELVVLGTPHLSDFSDGFRPESLEPLLMRLPQSGRRYVGWWKVRSLRMGANIRAVMAGGAPRRPAYFPITPSGRSSPKTR